MPSIRILAYVRDDAIVVLDDPPAITRAVRDELARADSDAAQKSASEPAFLPEAFYRDEERGRARSR